MNLTWCIYKLSQFTLVLTPQSLCMYSYYLNIRCYQQQLTPSWLSHRQESHSVVTDWGGPIYKTTAEKKRKMLWIWCILAVVVLRSYGAPLLDDEVRKPWLKDYMMKKDEDAGSKEMLCLNTGGKESK